MMMQMERPGRSRRPQDDCIPLKTLCTVSNRSSNGRSWFVASQYFRWGLTILLRTQLKISHILVAMASHEESTAYLSGWRLGVVITSLFFGTFLIALDTNILNVSVPRISTDFHALDDVAWYGTSYLVTITAFQPIYGTFYKFFDTTIVRVLVQEELKD
jgi:hypothetical protein